MERSEIKAGMYVTVDEGEYGDTSYIPYKVLVVQVGTEGSIKGVVCNDNGGSSFYIGNLSKNDRIWFAPFQASPFIPEPVNFDPRHQQYLEELSHR